jgi:hypothetical protein
MTEHTGIERWLPVTNWKGVYDVSDYGRVRSLGRYVLDSLGRTRYWPGCMLEQFILGKGYKAVTLQLSGKRVKRYVHSLVLETFVGLCPPDQECLHGPNGQSDNGLTNLSYGTRTQNMRDKRRDGTNYNSNRVCCPRDHRLMTPNLVVCILPRRTCQACQRTRTALHQKGWTKEDFKVRKDEFQAITDRYYIRIMG